LLVSMARVRAQPGEPGKYDRSNMAAGSYDVEQDIKRDLFDAMI